MAFTSAALVWLLLDSYSLAIVYSEGVKMQHTFLDPLPELGVRWRSLGRRHVEFRRCREVVGQSIAESLG